jgi:DNA-binding transcriptional LysR family regulator
MPPSLDDLSIFAAIARTGNISGAANELHVPKSSVSRALARLEAALGVELVHRTTRRARLSTAGEVLLKRAGPLLTELGTVIAELPERDPTPAGLLRVTCTIDFGAIIMAELVARFVRLYPKVEVEVHATNHVLDLVSGGFDLAVRFSPKRRLTNSPLLARRVGAIEPMLVASPEYLARQGTPRSPGELERHEWVTYSGAESLVLEAPGGAERLAARGRIRCDDMFFARAAVRAGAGIALLPSFLARRDVEAGLLVAVLPQWSLPTGAIWIVHPAARVLPAKVRAFRDLLIASLDPGPPGSGKRSKGAGKAPAQPKTNGSRRRRTPPGL